MYALKVVGQDAFIEGSIKYTRKTPRFITRPYDIIRKALWMMESNRRDINYFVQGRGYYPPGTNPPQKIDLNQIEVITLDFKNGHIDTIPLVVFIRTHYSPSWRPAVTDQDQLMKEYGI